MRPIDADGLLKRLNKTFVNFGYVKAINEVANLIKDMPTVDTEKHGHWRKLTHYADFNDYECSACGGIVCDVKEVPKDSHLTLNSYCCLCGAKMDEVYTNED